ncbi:putative transmembrane emp24 domain-containing protein [Helianthus annuus]|nr:putative transmembrane emp24 domain-containing protein [Helianthus annuus]
MLITNNNFDLYHFGTSSRVYTCLFFRDFRDGPYYFEHTFHISYNREREMQELNKVTNSRMAWLSFLSLFICLSVAGMQIWHLKSFFEKKKLI